MLACCDQTAVWWRACFPKVTSKCWSVLLPWPGEWTCRPMLLSSRFCLSFILPVFFHVFLVKQAGLRAGQSSQLSWTRLNWTRSLVMTAQQQQQTGGLRASMNTMGWQPAKPADQELAIGFIVCCSQGKRRLCCLFNRLPHCRHLRMLQAKKWRLLNRRNSGLLEYRNSNKEPVNCHHSRTGNRWGSGSVVACS